MTRVRWVLELHPEFPSAEEIRSLVPDPLVLSRSDLLMGRLPASESPMVGYGTMAGMSALARQSSAVFDDFPKLRCSSYYRWVYDLLGRTCILVPFSALPHLPLQRMFGSQVFVRSDSNFKLFPAEVIEVKQVARWMDLYSAHQDELLVLSEVIPLDTEYRCFCRDGSFVCGSSYPEPPWLPVPSHVREFAEIAAVRLSSQGITVCTIDVGVGEKSKLHLVEAGGVNSWGLYGADPRAFIELMEAEAIRIFEDS